LEKEIRKLTIKVHKKQKFKKKWQKLKEREEKRSK
jgi:hypothetical protein